MAKGASFVPALRAAATAGGVSVDCASVRAWRETAGVDLEYHPPVLHSAAIVESLKRNHRPFYKDLGAALSREDGESVRRMLLRDPYYNADAATAALEPAPSVCVLHRGDVVSTVGPNGILCMNDACISLKACGSDGAENPSHKYKATARPGIGVSVAQPFYAHFHFVAEMLPRLALVSKHPRFNLDDVWLHFGTLPMSNAIVETVALVLGVNDNDRVRERIIGGARTNIAFDTLIVPEPVGCGSPSRLMLLGLHRHLVDRRASTFTSLRPAALGVSAAAYADTDSDRIAILLRRDARLQRRAIQNHDALARALKNATESASLAFHVFDNADAASLSFVDQARFFERADLVVGAHGAGLVNVLHLRAGSIVVEILPKRSEALTCYLHMSAKLGLRYHGIIAKEEDDFSGSLAVAVDVVAALVAKAAEARIHQRAYGWEL